MHHQTMQQIHRKTRAHVAGGLLAVCFVVAGGCSEEPATSSSEATKIEYARNAPEPIENNNVPPFAGANYLPPVQGDSNVDGHVRPADFSWQQSGPTLPSGTGQKLNAADAWHEELAAARPGRPAESLYPREETGGVLSGPAPRYQGATNGDQGETNAPRQPQDSVASAPAFRAPPPWAVPETDEPAPIQDRRQPPPPETYGPRFDLDPPAETETDADALSHSFGTGNFGGNDSGGKDSGGKDSGSTADHPYPQSHATTQRPTTPPAAAQSHSTQSNSSQSLPWQNTPWESSRRNAAAGPAKLPPAVARQTEELTKRAFELAGRGAVFSAREQLIRALEVVAESLDAAEQTVDHRRALAAAFRALDEAVDFAPRGATLLQEIDIKTVVSGHLTPVIKDAGVDLQQISAIECSRAYYTFAQRQLAFACGSQQAASLALYGLGKLNTGLAESGTDHLQDAATRSIVFHQAALSVDNGNWRAANELAVQLARSSRYEEARGWLQHATQLSDSPELWSNLAAVHGYLGEERLARQAAAKSERLAQRTTTGSSRFNVQWLPPQAFTGAPPNR